MSGILLIDNAPTGRQQLANLLRELGEVVAVPSISEATLAIAGKTAWIAVINFDFSAPAQAEAVLHDVRARYPQLPLVLAVDNPDLEGLEKALRTGISGCLLRTDSLDEWKYAITAAGKKELYVSNALAPSLLKHVLHSLPPSQSGGLPSLTDRELAIFEMLGTGLRPPEIAERLALSCKTVEAHREKIKHRLGFSDSAALVHFACMWVQHQSTGAPLPEHLVSEFFPELKKRAFSESSSAP